jgi:hypothetical protein
MTRPDGSPWGPVKLEALDRDAAKMDSADYAALIMQGLEEPFSWLTRGYDRMPTVWSLHAGRDFSRRMLIRKITPVDMYRYTVQLVNDDPRVYSQNIAVPPWEYRSNLPVVTVLAAPKSLAATWAGGALSLSWLPVSGAQWYEVQASGNGQTWENRGRANINALSFAVPQGMTFVRVRGANGVTEGAWAEWSGDTGILVPQPPLPALDGPYAGAAFSASWLPVTGATAYTVRVFAGGNIVPARIHQTEVPAFSYTYAMGVADGGPWRTLRVDAAASNASGESLPAALDISDPAPAVIAAEDLTAVPGVSGVTLDRTDDPETDITGYVLARGATPDFAFAQVLESRIVTGLPYTWTGLEPDTVYYFRVAAKDAFFDVAGDYANLPFGGVVTVTTQETTE